MNKVHRAEDLTLIATPLYLFKTIGSIFIRFPFFATAWALQFVVFTDFQFSPPSNNFASFYHLKLTEMLTWLFGNIITNFLPEMYIIFLEAPRRRGKWG